MQIGDLIAGEAAALRIASGRRKADTPLQVGEGRNGGDDGDPIGEIGSRGRE